MTSPPDLVEDVRVAPSVTDLAAVPALRPRLPSVLPGASIAVAALLLTPIAYLFLQAHGAGVSTMKALIFRHLTATLLWNTVSLTFVVVCLCTVIGTLAAWCVERTDLPGRRVWAVLLVVPFAIPDLIISYGWATFTTAVHGFQGAALIMTLSLYPLVYLFVAASLRSSDPGLEETARGLGLGRVKTFLRVTLGQCRGAILGSGVIIALIMLSEYGTFEDLGYRTFTTEIFTEFGESLDVPVACALAFIILLISLFVLGGDAIAQPKGRAARTGRLVQREIPRRRLGRATVPVELGLLVLAALSLGLPIGVSFYWMFEGGRPQFAGGSIGSAALHTVVYSAIAAAGSTLLATPVALFATRYGSRWVQLLERSTFLVLAMPGLIVALALSYYSERYAHGFGYQSAPMLIVAYVMLFFPLALVGVKASAAYAPVDLENAGSSLGLGRLAVMRRVTLPLLAPGLATGFCLVFLAAVTELTATLFLAPAGVQTLATQFWAYEQNLSYGQGAPYALVLLAIVAIPAYVLARYFNRLPAKATRQS